jgi:NADH:ubiquinone oxidoreductase subunit C
MDEALNDLGVYIAAALPQDVIDTTVANGELVVHARMHTVVKLLTFLRDDSNCLFKVLLDMCGSITRSEKSGSRSSTPAFAQPEPAHQGQAAPSARMCRANGVLFQRGQLVASANLGHVRDSIFPITRICAAC